LTKTIELAEQAKLAADEEALAAKGQNPEVEEALKRQLSGATREREDLKKQLSLKMKDSN